jgi:hypothetical protein
MVNGGTLSQFFTLALDGSGQLHCPALYPLERAFSTHWKGGWVGSRTGLDIVEKRKISYFDRESNPANPLRNPSLY